MFTGADRARAILWWVGRSDSGIGMTTAEICAIIERSGHPKQNASRLNSQLASDKRRIHRVPGSKAWRLNPRGRAELDGNYELVAEGPRIPKASDAVLTRTLFNNTRGYIENVVRQINASYDAGLYDCCAVMCRRLLETLIIEVYEHVGRAVDIKGNDGHFFMFADLLRTISKDAAFNISRNAQRGLEDFKKLGDLSAHNRRFNAHKSDIEQIQSGLRISSEELLHLAGLI
jgi:hypothetical protein